ncbi:hypothetical protein D3P09_11750 [Paenibacillus pinisoli]|uniref:Uncharacterized protein n=1 Tax=Paenibacillus pinisoli TaxID=1276110 RepID=A0A3A6PEE9_9BACL|nr:pyocin knob domain-containing protein [Paenibacillus pinisoli]RJX40042.1 hypothetical protein D3P09_11750 [Paenibacillus pinisoli]
MARTDWDLNKTVGPQDMNQIGREINALYEDNSVTDARIGDRTISDAASPTGNQGKLTVLLGWLAYMVKSITGKADWKTAPRTTLENAVKRDGDTMTSHLNVQTVGASVRLKPLADTDTGVLGTQTQSADGTWQWGTGSQPSSGKWGVYDYLNSRWALEIGQGSDANSGLKYRTNTVHHAGNHNSTGDPHTQYLLKTGGTMSGVLKAAHGIDQRLPENSFGPTDLPSTYPTGISMFFINNVAGWPGPSSYGTIVTYKGYSNNPSTQYFYPYNSDVPIQYRNSLFGNNTWTAWRTVLDSNNHNSTGNPHTQYALADSTPVAKTASGSLNTITTPGMYRLQQTHADAPSTTYSYGNMLVLRASNADTITQMIFPYQGPDVGKIAFRSGNPTDVGGISTWSPWRLIWNQANMGAGSGMDADMVDGYHASISSAANSIVVQNTDESIGVKFVKTVIPTVNGGNLHYHLRNGSEAISALRFGIGLITEESGSNSGSDFGIWRYNDTGAGLGNVLLINRSTGNSTFSGIVSAPRFNSSIATGTAPLSVSSTTRVTNLNADMLDDCHATSLATPNTVAIRGASGTIKAAAPQAADDVARKAETDAVQSNLNVFRLNLQRSITQGGMI